MKRFLSFVALLSVLVPVPGQQGSPILLNFGKSRDIENQSWSICQDNYNVMLFANRKGILMFDGEEYQNIRIPVIPYAMQKDPSTGKIYIGGDNTFGHLEKIENGEYRYFPLPSDSIPSGIITRIYFDGKSAWFYGEQSIIRYNLETGQRSLRLDSKPGNLFSGMMITPKNTFVNISGKGLFRIEADTLFPIVTGYLTAKSDILFALPYNANFSLVGISDGSVSLFDGIKYYPYQLKDNGYLKNSLLSEGIALGDTAYAFSTLDGGAEVVGKLSGKVLFLINNQCELPDDEILAIGSDNSGGLWLSHQFGLTRADLNIPVRNFSVYSGMKGNLASFARFGNELYTSTSEGIYYLTQVANYTGVEIYLSNENQFPSKPDQAAEQVQTKPNTRRGIFAKIFGKKNSVQEIAPEKAAAKAQPANRVKKTIQKLQSLSTAWVKIEGLNEKCRQLVATPYGLLAATNGGLYFVSNHRANLIVKDRYINSISWSPYSGKYYIGTGDGYLSVSYNQGKWLAEVPDREFVNPVYSVVQKDGNTIWLGCDNMALKSGIVSGAGKMQYISYNVRKNFPERYSVDLVNDTVLLFTETGVSYYDSSSDRFKPFRKIFSDSIDMNDFQIPLSNSRIYKKGGNWYSTSHENRFSANELSVLKIFDEIVSVYVESNYIWVIAGNNKLYCIDRQISAKAKPATQLFVRSIYNDRGTTFNLSDVKFDRGDNVINFSIIAPGYIKEGTTDYQYTINKVMQGWSPWETRTRYSKAITRQGDYILRVRARDLFGNVSKEQAIKFTIRAPFTKTLLFYFLSGLTTLFIIILIVRFREQQLHNQNRLLELKVKERTAEIEAQKEEITASIEYASRIQMAMLPFVDNFSTLFSDNFIMFKPRDIVSGDFYWLAENEKSIFFTVADCTGHGVPGAFMSTLGISTLHEIISNSRNLKANTVLNILRTKIMTALHQTGRVGEAADGMDISFCVLNKEKSVLEFSGAYNPLLIFQGGELKEYKADRMPIGIHYGDPASFTNYEIPVSKGDTLYIFSDGFNDQFGGPEGAKYKKSNLKKLLTQIYYLPMVEQKNILEKELSDWRGSGNQIDDITIIGIRI